MKNILSFSALIIVCLSLLACSSSKQVLNIDPNQSVEVAFNDFTSYEAKVSNKSMKDIEVKVIDKSSAEQTSGFGLAQMTSDKVMVSEASKLILKNTGDKTAKVVVAAKSKQITYNKSNPAYISFTLRNNSAKSIPLIIPTVMNPNLSPFSNSGVDLKIGQEILFRNNGKKYVLLTVSDEIKNGDVLEISKLLKEKKKELGI